MALGWSSSSEDESVSSMVQNPTLGLSCSCLADVSDLNLHLLIPLVVALNEPI